MTSPSRIWSATAAIDVSGTYADEKAEVVKLLKRDVLPGMVPGDTLMLVRIDSQSYEKENLEVMLTLEYAGEVGSGDAASRFRPFDSDVAGRIAWSAGDFARTGLETRGIFDVRNGEIIVEALAARQLRFIHDDLKAEVGGRYLRAAPNDTTLLSGFPTNNSQVHARLQFDF